jgi:hypothetical protein
MLPDWYKEKMDAGGSGKSVQKEFGFERFKVIRKNQMSIEVEQLVDVYTAEAEHVSY